MGIIQEISTLIRARYPILYLISYEEERVTDAVKAIAREARRSVYVWSETMGLQPANGDNKLRTPDKQTQDPFSALEVIRTTNEKAIFILQDFHPYLSTSFAHRISAIRKLRDLVDQLHTSYKTIILISPVLELPAELEKDVNVIDYPLPTLDDMDQLLTRVHEQVKQAANIDITPTLPEREMILKAALGLTLNEADNVFARCVVEKKKFDIDLIVAEKEQLIRKSGLLEYYHAVAGLDDLGGLDLLKSWLQQRSNAFSKKARDFGLPAPRGVLLTGVQGCGKSLAAKVVANLWRMPLLRLDMGRLFSSYIGSSEDNVRRAIKIAESISPVVLWIDEIEKAMSGMQSSGSVDGGTTARVFGSLLTWMQEKTLPVFVVATANDITGLPPELLRKGRFDEIFFADLPSAEEREQILAIHLKRRKRNPNKFDMKKIAVAADGFSGSELEQAIIAGLYNAFAKERDLTSEDLLDAILETIPLSRTAEDKIMALREWSAMRARPASANQRERTEAAVKQFRDRQSAAFMDMIDDGNNQ